MLVPALGGKVRDVFLAGRQWLWHNPDVPFALPRAGAPYAASEVAGGFDECFPTMGSCRLPRWVAGARWVKLPDHGELWAQPPEIMIMTDQEGHSATCTWNGTALPYRFTRRITVHPEGWVAFAYSATNTGTHRLPFLWSSNPLFPLTARTRIHLPEGARTRVWTQAGVDFGKRGAEHQWPKLSERGAQNGKKLDLSRPFLATGGDYSCKLFVELPRREVTIVIEEGSARLEMHVHGREIPSVGVSINRQAAGSTPVRRTMWPFGKKPRGGCTMAIEPCLGAPESLRAALGKWDDAHWLEPGGTARWGMTWRGTTKATEDGRPGTEDR